MDGGLAPATGLAGLLQTYGPWGLVSILMLTVWYLFTKLQAARDRNDGILEAQVRAATALVEESVKASVEQRNALDKIADALKAVERRLESVENKVK